MITIVSVGKPKDELIDPVIDDYAKRLRQPYDIVWKYLPHATGRSVTEPVARRDESARLLEMIDEGDSVILLDERGSTLSSPALANKFNTLLSSSGKRVVLIIGGAYGVDDSVRTRADVVWSFGPAVFPHRIVRLLVIEQIYRAQAILGGSPYHHE